MSAPVVLYIPSNDDFDFDLYLIAPAGMTEADAEAKAVEVHRNYWGALVGDHADLEDYRAALEAAGFISPVWARSPTWDIRSGKRPK